ncbi:MAG: ATP-binding protein [Cellvibrionaceae bacterium]|nr:ATP-binding protein [Cellvibrionaceae bacterium]
MSSTLGRLRKHPLQRYLAVVVFLSIALPAVVGGGFLIWQNYQRTLEHDSVRAANHYMDLLQAGMSMPLWNVSPDLGRPLLESVLVDAAVVSIRVTTDGGEAFLQFERDSENAIVTVDNIVLSRAVHYGQDVIGQVEMAYSLSAARARAASETRLLAIIIFAQLVVSLLTLSWVLHRKVLSPLQQLGAAAAGIAKGDLKTTIPALAQDEFGELSQQLDIMRSELDIHFSQLEKRVDMRTLELRVVNETLQNTLDRLQQTQHYLVQSEKLAALGSLVAGVAHELNTPIGNGLTVATSMCDSCDTLKQKLAEGLTRAALENFVRDMDEGAQLVSRNLEKASELVSGFKQVAMDRTSVQRRQFSLTAILQETRLTLSPAFKRTPFVVDIDVAEDVMLDSYPGPLGQVVTNLLNNALVHAFDGRAAGAVIMRAEKKHDAVELIVEDDGVGIAEEHLNRIFDPFFTTKLGAGGSGLGMHIVHNIVTGILGGKIRLWSQLDRGTRFILTLPLSAPREKNAATESTVADLLAAD